MAASSGHGRFSRPENFTMRAASHRLSTLVMVASTAAAGGIAVTRKSTSRLALDTPGTLSGASGRRAGFDAQHARRARCAGRRGSSRRRCRNWGWRPPRPARRERPPRSPAGRADTIRAPRRRHCRRGPRQHGEIAEPPGRKPGAGQEREEEHRRRTRPRARARRSARAISAAQWLQPSPAIMIGSGAR